MNINAFAELVLDWQNIPFTLPNVEKAKDSIIGVRATIIEQSIAKNNSIPAGVRQQIKLPLVEEGGIFVSEKFPLLLLKADNVRVVVRNGQDETQIEIVTQLAFSLSQYKRLTGNLPRGFIRERRLYIKKLLANHVDLEGVFHNPLAVLAFKGEDPDTWEVEESLFGQFKSFFAPAVKTNDNGEIRITEGNVQGNV